MSNDSGSGGIILILAIIVGIIMLIMTAIYAVLTIGSIFGAVVSIKNFVVAIKEAITERKAIGKFKNAAVKAAMSTLPYEGYIYEKNAAKMYIFGPVYADILFVIKRTFQLNFSYSIDFSTVTSEGIGGIAKRIFLVGKGISVYVFGTIFTIVCCALLCVLSGACALLVYPAAGILFLIEFIYFRIKKINFRCTSCKKQYTLPKYVCPFCGISHEHLKPGLYGLRTRICLCGTKLPLTAKSMGSTYAYDPASGKRISKDRILFKDMNAFCPFCGAENNAGLSHSISIAIIGGASAGKTTFKVAFQHDFLEDEIIKYGIEYALPDKASEDELAIANQYYSGKAFIPATNGNINYDVTAFCFALKNKKFAADRMVQIYDLPGEKFSQGDAKEGWNHYSFTEGAVFILDPFCLTAVKNENSDELKGSTMGICTVDVNVLIESLISTLSSVNVPKEKGKFTMPIALVISKVDTTLLKKQCGSIAVNSVMAGAPGVFANEFDAMDYVCRCFLSKNGCDNFIQNLDNYFKNVHFFSCSAVGYVPKASLTRFSPKNVVEIMQWLMLRADKKQLGSVWTPQTPITDVPEEQRRLYLEDRSYYDRFVLDALTK